MDLEDYVREVADLRHPVNTRDLAVQRIIIEGAMALAAQVLKDFDLHTDNRERRLLAESAVEAVLDHRFRDAVTSIAHVYYMDSLR